MNGNIKANNLIDAPCLRPSAAAVDSTTEVGFRLTIDVEVKMRIEVRGKVEVGTASSADCVCIDTAVTVVASV
jgi:hypothetical protein